MHALLNLVMKYTDYLQEKIGDDHDKMHLFMLLFECIKNISDHLDITKGHASTINKSGDQQLAMDVQADMIMQKTLTACDCVAQIASEEQDMAVHLNGDKYCVVYDPLDGSSLVDANMSIGTVIGVYPGKDIVGRKGSEMIGSMAAVYGPKTTVMLSVGDGVDEFILKDDGFVFKKENIRIKDESIYFAPGNIRAAKTEKWYRKLIDYWLDNGYKLRYSGGMVVDVNHLLIKGGGVFTYPGCCDVPEGKLRLVYECAPMAYLLEQAGGCAYDDDGVRILDKEISSLHERTPVYLGSCQEVDKVIEFLRNFKE